MLDVRPVTVHGWVTIYRAQGMGSLKTKRRGKLKIILTDRQEAMLKRRIVGKLPGQLRLDFALWTTQAVIALIKKLFKKRISKTISAAITVELGLHI